MKILLSGASGFIAHHLIKKCQDRGWFVIGVDKRPIPPNHNHPDHFIQADVFDLGFRDLMGVDYVAHMAFSTNIPNSTRHPKETTYENIDMTVHLLEVCRDAGVKKVFFPSTASLYSHNPTPWTEEMQGFPIEPYSWQKLSCEFLCQMYSKVYNLPTVVGRFFQVFGEFQRDDTALAAFMRFKKEGKPITLTETMAQSKFKSGQRDFIYVGDIAEAVCVMLEKGEGVYNVCSGKVRTMEEIAKAMKVEVKWIPKREYEVERHEGTNERIKSLGWKPTVDVIDWLK